MKCVQMSANIKKPTGFKSADGSVEKFYNSSDKSIIYLHFKWMKDYRSDGVFVLRF